MTIWKFPLALMDRVTVELPKGARVLTVQMQGRQPCLWALVDEHATPTDRVFLWRGTGHSANTVDPARYIGTVQIQALVFHLFEAA